MSTSTFVFPYPLRGSFLTAPALSPMPVESPTLSVLDSSSERGDGAFETLGIVDGHAQALDVHLHRLAHSARLLDLPDLDLDVLAEICRRVAGSAADGGEHSLKLVISRGGPGAGTPRAWIVLSPMPDYRAARTEGVAVVTLSKGYASTVGDSAPWLLHGAKTLSYASHMASLREARRREADDVVFETTDGFLLEGPTSTLLLRHENVLTTPEPALGVLHGTTQRDIFDNASAWGLEARYGRPRADDLRSADGAWLVSSVRMAAPIVAVDGVELPVDRAGTTSFNDFLLARR